MRVNITLACTETGDRNYISTKISGKPRTFGAYEILPASEETYASPRDQIIRSYQLLPYCGKSFIIATEWCTVQSGVFKLDKQAMRKGAMEELKNIPDNQRRQIEQELKRHLTVSDAWQSADRLA